MGINVSAGPIVLTFDAYFTTSQYPPALRNSALDQTFDCRYEDAIPKITISLVGEWLNKGFNKSADPIIITLTLLGDLPGSTIGFVVVADPIYIYVTLKGEGALYPFIHFHPESLKSNLIRWSDIGHLDFTINRGNVAGERRVDWAGWVYDIKKLGNKVVVYGENGVSILTPSGNTYGLDTIYKIGLKSKQAVTGNDTTHYFIDNEGQLFSLGETLEKLDYSEYLSAMSNLVMSFDAENEFVYICDGTLGYVYSSRDKSLGVGPVNITGISSQDGTLYVVSPTAIVTPVFEMCTDIYDLGTRENKIISSVKIGINTTKVLSVAIDYRTDKAENFTQSSWHEVDKEGKVFFPCYGCEFKFRIKTDAYEYFELDYIEIKGNVNIAERRPLEWEKVYAVERLGERIVTYGDGGIIALPLDGGDQTIYEMEPKGKNAIVGTESAHYFVDVEGQLWSITDTLKLLDYSEYLSSMGNDLVMSYDVENDLIYICDGILGYVYSPRSNSFGKGPINITGIGSQGGILYAVAPAAIVTPTFEICTDIYDLDTRENKITSSVKIGIDTTKVLSVAVDYRIDKADDFIQSSWYETDKEGKVFFPCYGCEFRFRIKTDAYEYFELDYIEIKGNVNIAERRPLEWEKVYAIARLGERIVTYGDGGIIVLPLAGGDQTIYELEPKGKNAIAGTEAAHYFIDIKGQLWSITDTLQLLDYSEYLSLMNNNLVMSYDVENDLIYICDGILGYIYSPRSNSLGKGPINITGIGSQDGTLYAVSPAAIVTPTFEICTDIYDLGTRENKIISSVKIGTDTTKVLSVAIDYRLDKAEDFIQSSWYETDKEGKVFFPCYGCEFRVRIKTDAYEYFELDYVRIKGNVNIAERRLPEWEKVYAIARLGERVVTYGDGGIVVLPSAGGYETIYEPELKGKDAITGTESAHYFIDIEGQLWSITDTLKLLNYSEFLSPMNNNLVMSYDVENDLIYICDGTLGYVYSPKSNSLGKGPVNITGIGSQGGILHAVAPAAIAIPNFEICTDIYDLGTRKLKTIFSLEFGIDLQVTLQASIDYRRHKDQAFLQTFWHDVNEGGSAFITCNGREFRFRAKALNYEYFEIDRIDVGGEILEH